MDDRQIPRSLSHDERHAADAAFAGRPFNPRWSARARAVYDGIVRSLPTALKPQPPESSPTDADAALSAEPSTPAQDEQTSRQELAGPTQIPLHQALEAGSLIDVTRTAKELGLSFLVTVTKPLWETGIAPGTTDEERSARLRDVLMAFRLRLAVQPTMAPLIDFPALLAFPHGAVPQPVPLFALVQPDQDNQAMVTLLLPSEIATAIIPLN